MYEFMVQPLLKNPLDKENCITSPQRTISTVYTKEILPEANLYMLVLNVPYSIYL